MSDFDAHILVLEGRSYSLTHSFACRMRGTIHDCPVERDAAIWSQSDLVADGVYIVRPDGGVGGWDLEIVGSLEEARLALGGAERIAAERQRQIDELGYDAEHDRQHRGELAMAARCYALAAWTQTDPKCGWTVDMLEHNVLESGDWPWEAPAWNPSSDPVRNLEKAGALIAAEIDRILEERS